MGVVKQPMKDLGDYNGLIYNESDLKFCESFFLVFQHFFVKKGHSEEKRIWS